MGRNRARRHEVLCSRCPHASRCARCWPCTLDGIGAGIFGALFPIVIADLTRGTGRFNVAQGAVATVQGLGATLSATVAGVIIVNEGYTVAFWTLAAVAGVGFLLYARLMPETRPTAEAG
jgi:hypothetical protein